MKVGSTKNCLKGLTAGLPNVVDPLGALPRFHHAGIPTPQLLRVEAAEKSQMDLFFRELSSFDGSCLVLVVIHAPFWGSPLLMTDPSGNLKVRITLHCSLSPEPTVVKSWLDFM